MYVPIFDDSFVTVFIIPTTCSVSRSHSSESNLCSSVSSPLYLAGMFNVYVFQDDLKNDTPDSVFPNNWITFHENKKIAIGNFLPSLNISGNHNWNSGLTQNITTGILENQTTESSSINMSVALNIFSGLENIRKLHRANLDVLAKKYQLADMKEDVSLLVANAYLQILFNQEQ